MYVITDPNPVFYFYLNEKDRTMAAAKGKSLRSPPASGMMVLHSPENRQTIAARMRKTAAIERSGPLALRPYRVAIERAKESATAFEQPYWRGAGPNDFGLDRESTYFRMIQRNNGPCAAQMVIVREADAG